MDGRWHGALGLQLFEHVRGGVDPFGWASTSDDFVKALALETSATKETVAQ